VDLRRLGFVTDLSKGATVSDDVSAKRTPAASNICEILVPLIRDYARQQKLSEEARHYAKEIELRAKRKLGQILKESPKNTGAKGVGPIAVLKENRNQIPTYKEIKLDKKLAAKAQKLAEVPDERFERFLKSDGLDDDALIRKVSCVVAILLAVPSCYHQKNFRIIRQLTLIVGTVSKTWCASGTAFPRPGQGTRGNFRGRSSSGGPIQEWQVSGVPI
jgi:hypothetical protein